MIRLSGKRGLAFLTIMPVLLLVELGIGWGIFTNVKQTATIQNNINKLDQYLVNNTKYISSGESAQRGYLLTADPKFYNAYVDDIKEWAKNEEYYHSLPATVKRREVDEIEWMSQQKIADMGMAIQLYNKGGERSAITLVKTGVSSLTDSIRSRSTRLRYETGNAILVEREREYRLIYAFFAVITLLIVFSIGLAGFTYFAFKDYTQNLERSVKSLEEANETLRQYNFNSYHSLKTPLRNITGFLRLLEKKYKGEFDAEAKEYSQFITEGVKQLNGAIDDMRQKFLESGDSSKKKD